MPVIDPTTLVGKEIQPNMFMRRLVSQDPEEQKTAMAATALRVGQLEVGPGASIGPHSHTANDEVMVVLEGELEITLGDQVHKLKPGQAALAPINSTHIIANRGQQTAKCLIISHSEVRA